MPTVRPIHTPSARRRTRSLPALAILVAACSVVEPEPPTKEHGSAGLGPMVDVAEVEEVAVTLTFEPDPGRSSEGAPAFSYRIAVTRPDGTEPGLRAAQPIVVGSPPPTAGEGDDETDGEVDTAGDGPPEGMPALELPRRELDGPTPFEVCEIPPGAPEDLAYAAVFGADWRRAILVSPSWLGKPLLGFERLAGKPDEPVIWVRGFERRPAEDGTDDPFEFHLVAREAPPLGSITCQGVFPNPLSAACEGAVDDLFWAYGDVLVRTDRTGAPLTAGEAPARVLAMAASPSGLFALCRDGDTNSLHRWSPDLREGPFPVTDAELPGASTAVGLYVPAPPPPIPGMDVPTVGPGVVALQADTVTGAAPEGLLGTVPLASTFSNGRLFATFSHGERRTIWIGEIDTDSTLQARVFATAQDDLAPAPVGLIPTRGDRFWWACSERGENGHVGQMLEAIYDFDLGLRPRPTDGREAR